MSLLAHTLKHILENRLTRICDETGCEGAFLLNAPKELVVAYHAHPASPIPLLSAALIPHWVATHKLYVFGSSMQSSRWLFRQFLMGYPEPIEVQMHFFPMKLDWCLIIVGSRNIMVGLIDTIGRNAIPALEATTARYMQEAHL